ncbi:hypothetical protein RB598_000233 [Gaeumannomyces tritici]
MPKQHVLFGRPVPRVTFPLIAVGLFAVFSLLFTLPSSIPTGPNLSKFADLKASIPKFSGTSTWRGRFNPFSPPSHPPPRQKNDTLGEFSWYTNWKWLTTPFSSTITLDENRSLLPPLRARPPIYCYYDITLEKDQARRDAESALLLTWRRAWWAQGFRPIILSSAEAKNNPMYDEVQKLKLEPALETDFMKWLAWENMNGGLLAHHLLFPMGPYQDPLLVFLRRGEYPALTRWRDLDDGLFAGPKTDIGAAIKQALANPKLGAAKDFVTTAAVDKKDDVFSVETAAPASLAFYSEKNMGSKYGPVAKAITEDRAKGLGQLDRLVAAHLQVSFQNVFSDGVAVLKPLPLPPRSVAAMLQPAALVAARLAACLDSPLPASCPPNRAAAAAGCTPCSKGSLKVSTPERYSNATGVYTVGTVAHPYTLQTLSSGRASLDVHWLRRRSVRDAFLGTVMKGVVPDAVSSGARVLRFKDAVAGEAGAGRALWIPAERDLPDDLEWHFGFPLGNATAAGAAAALVVVDGSGPTTTTTTTTNPSDPSEVGLLDKAKKIRFSKEPADLAIRAAVEAWNLADTEAWRFARAFVERSVVERRKWEDEESKYAGGVGSDKSRRESSAGGGGGGALGRWLEKE